MDDIKVTLNKTEKIILYSLVGSVPVGLFVFFAFNMIFGKPTKQIIRETDSLETVNSVIDTLYNDSQNHNTRTAILRNRQIYYISSEWESEIETGDSLNKIKGSFLLEVYKKDGKRKVFDYRSIYPSKW
jgi:hypothetical protein